MWAVKQHGYLRSAMRAATTMGHRMEECLGYGSNNNLAAYCTHCNYMVNVPSGDNPQPHGKALDTPCPGIPR